ncbi:hypothetical protein L9F63_024448, partial [Diploptera punctata]
MVNPFNSYDVMFTRALVSYWRQFSCHPTIAKRVKFHLCPGMFQDLPHQNIALGKCVVICITDILCDNNVMSQCMLLEPQQMATSFYERSCTAAAIIHQLVCLEHLQVNEFQNSSRLFIRGLFIFCIFLLVVFLPASSFMATSFSMSSS